jgi:hypothetical protein
MGAGLLLDVCIMIMHNKAAFSLCMLSLVSTAAAATELQCLQRTIVD